MPNFEQMHFGGYFAQIDFPMITYNAFLYRKTEIATFWQKLQIFQKNFKIVKICHIFMSIVESWCIMLFSSDLRP